ncbi:MAG TPA: sugar transferase [Mesorhizobium sp.]
MAPTVPTPYVLSRAKRFLDVALAVPLAAVGLPLVLVGAALIWATTRGSPLFSQVRVGRNQQVFRCHKLRTMWQGTANVPTHEASLSAITPVGRVLRATKIDELPQLWNVICGEMSLVGPRPCLPTQFELIACRDRMGVFAVRPGITGHAQVQGVDMSTPQRLAEVDRDYLACASLWLDLALLAKTVLPGTASGR